MSYTAHRKFRVFIGHPDDVQKNVNNWLKEIGNAFKIIDYKQSGYVTNEIGTYPQIIVSFLYE